MKRQPRPRLAFDDDADEYDIYAIIPDVFPAAPSSRPRVLSAGGLRVTRTIGFRGGLVTVMPKPEFEE